MSEKKNKSLRRQEDVRLLDEEVFEEFEREFDTLKSKNVPQSLEIGLFFVKFLFLIYSNV